MHRAQGLRRTDRGRRAARGGRALTPSGPVSLDDLAGPDAPAVLARLRSAGPVVRVPALDAWLVTGYADAVRVMRDDTLFTVDDPRFSTARVTGASMLSLDGPEHRRHRGPFVDTFRPREVERRFATLVDRAAAGLLARVRADGAADLRPAFAGPLSVLTIAHALGLDDVETDRVLDWYARIVAAVSGMTADSPVPPDARHAMASLGGHVRRGLGSMGQSVLAAARGALADDDVVANAAVMMFGGIETTEATILTSALHLLRHPPALAAVRADRGLIVDAVEESLRLEPAAAAVDRYATRDVEIAGAAIRAGELVRVSVTAANRDPAVFDDPDAFLPGRPGVRRHVAFAQGPHVCLAADLARLETRIALEHLLDLPGLRLVEDAPPVGLVFRKPAALAVAWDA